MAKKIIVPGQGAGQGVPPNVKEKPRVKCENCGGEYFKHVLGLKVLSGLEAGQAAGQDVLMHMPIFRCDDCNQVLEKFVPDQF